MIGQVIRDIKWKYLLISCVLAIIILFPFVIIVDYLKQSTFEFFLRHELLIFPQIDKFPKFYASFMGSIYWYPIHIISTVTVQFVSCSYLVARSKNFEYTNAIANAAILGGLLYRQNLFFVLVAFATDIIVAHKAKIKQLAENNDKVAGTNKLKQQIDET
jgi:hypothetical protein